MNVVGSELLAIAYFVITGWLALWPLRRRLGAFGYHLAALPTGMLASPIAAALTALAGYPFDLLSAAAGSLLLVAAFWIVQRLTVGRVFAEPDVPVTPASFGVAAGSIGVLAAVVGLLRYTVANADSYVSYWPLGVELTRTGAANIRVFSSRASMLPGISAVHVEFGSDWAYVIYPLIAASLLGWIAWTLWTGPLAGASRRTKLLVAGGAVGFLAIEPSFLFHSFFVHSHMISALYLLMSLTCVWMSVRPGASAEEAEKGPDAAYLLMAGAFAAGFALTRTDGLAYQFIPVAAAIAALTMQRVRGRAVAAFFAPLLVIVYTVFLEGFIKLGFWEDPKLSGKPAAMILGVLAFAVLGPWIVQWLDRVLPFSVAGERFLGLLVGASAVLVAAVFAVKWASASLAIKNTAINLFQGYGGYHYLWYAIVALLAISLFTGDALRAGSWTRWAFLGVALFYLIAALVHGTSHAGRIGPGDSLNRVVFHAIPLVVWYVAAVVARILGSAAVADDAVDIDAPADARTAEAV